MTKDDMAQGLASVAQTKMGAATIATGTTGFTTGLMVERIGPYIPIILATITVIFGLVHIWIHWREMKAQERIADGSK